MNWTASRLTISNVGHLNTIDKNEVKSKRCQRIRGAAKDAAARDCALLEARDRRARSRFYLKFLSVPITRRARRLRVMSTWKSVVLFAPLAVATAIAACGGGSSETPPPADPSAAASASAASPTADMPPATPAPEPAAAPTPPPAAAPEPTPAPTPAAAAEPPPAKDTKADKKKAGGKKKK
jgi:hypothetical protein